MAAARWGVVGALLLVLLHEEASQVGCCQVAVGVSAAGAAWRGGQELDNCCQVVPGCVSGCWEFSCCCLEGLEVTCWVLHVCWGGSNAAAVAAWLR
jgi:hypothetical protein